MPTRRLQLVEIRRGILFLTAIGTPVVTGLATGETRAALLGAVGGLVLSFADSDGPLWNRLRLLGLAAGCMAIGASVGHLLRDAEVAFWATFVLATFAVGLATRGGREPLIAGRDGAMAFVVAAGIPSISAAEIAFGLGAVALCAVLRTLDQLLFGPLPPVPAGPAPQAPSGHGGWIRYALAYAGAAVAALWIGMTLDPTRAVWVVTTTLLVMQPDARASYRRIVQRITGTFAGVLAAWAITAGVHSAVLVCAAVLVVAPFVPHHIGSRYWLHTALIALVILLAYDLASLDTGGIEDLLTERLKDMLLGCAIAVVGTAVAFARADPDSSEATPDSAP